MSHFKLKLGLSFIPFVGFFIVIIWGMVSTYNIFHKRIHAFIYAIICMAVAFIAALLFALIWYFFMQFVELSNISLVIGIALAISFVLTYIIAGISFVVQYFYCRKLIASKNDKVLL